MQSASQRLRTAGPVHPVWYDPGCSSDSPESQPLVVKL